MKGIRKQVFPIFGRKRPNIKRPLVERKAVKAIPRVSQTYFKDAVPKKNYSFRVAKGWKYCDRMPDVINWIQPISFGSSHLLLSDMSGRARFALRYERAKHKGITIESIQRERTQYIKRGDKKYFWDAELETQRSKEFQKKLGGMHPAEFLLSEFIYRYQGEIRRGTSIYLELLTSELGKQIYGPLIDRFFKNKPVKVSKFPSEKVEFRLYELDLAKKRVKQILGI